MDIIVVSIHITAAVILVLTVLLQAGKGSGMGAAFGGSSGTVFGARGPATLISKITCGAAVVFMITSLNLALSQGGISKKGSVMDEWSSPPAASVPAATPAPSAPMATPATPMESLDESAPAPAAMDSLDESSSQVEAADEVLDESAAPATDDAAAPASEPDEAAAGTEADGRE